MVLVRSRPDRGQRCCPPIRRRCLLHHGRINLAGREVASWLLSEATGWSLVPPTVLRGFLGQPLSAAVLDVLRRVRSELDGALGATLAKHVTRAEVRAVWYRTERLLATETFPAPDGNWPAILWPAF